MCRVGVGYASLLMLVYMWTTALYSLLFSLCLALCLKLFIIILPMCHVTLQPLNSVEREENTAELAYIFTL